jgi:Fic family protein
VPAVTETIETIARRVLAARDGDEDARDTIIEDAIALAKHVLANRYDPPPGAAYETGRKRHIISTSDDYLRLLENGATYTTVALAATALNVSEASARRNLDGLVTRGKLVAVDPDRDPALSQGPMAGGRYADRVRYVAAS